MVRRCSVSSECEDKTRDRPKERRGESLADLPLPSAPRIAPRLMPTEERDAWLLSWRPWAIEQSRRWLEQQSAEARLADLNGNPRMTMTLERRDGAAAMDCRVHLIGQVDRNFVHEVFSYLARFLVPLFVSALCGVGAVSSMPRSTSSGFGTGLVFGCVIE